MKRKSTEPPIAIAITIPSLTKKGSASERGYQRSLKWLRAGECAAMRFTIGRQPKEDVLHLYIVSSGKVIVRFTLAGFETAELRCWDGTIRTGTWAVCVEPAEPPHEVLHPGFRGFRYLTSPLW